MNQTHSSNGLSSSSALSPTYRALAVDIDSSSLVIILNRKYVEVNERISQIQQEMLKNDDEVAANDIEASDLLSIAEFLDQDHLKHIALSNALWTTITLLKLV